MALNVTDAAGVYQGPATAPATEGWSFSKMLADPNFQLLLANMGKAADPEGVGGVIGGAAANMISSKAAQGAMEKSEAQRQTQIKQLIDTLGGVTPKDKPGVTSIKRTPSGGLALDYDLPALEGTAAQSVLASAPSAERTSSLTGKQPKAQPVIPTAPQVATTPVRQPAPTGTAGIQTRGVRDIADIFPFY